MCCQVYPVTDSRQNGQMDDKDELYIHTGQDWNSPMLKKEDKGPHFIFHAKLVCLNVCAWIFFYVLYPTKIWDI